MIKAIFKEATKMAAKFIIIITIIIVVYIWFTFSTDSIQQAFLNNRNYIQPLGMRSIDVKYLSQKAINMTQEEYMELLNSK